MKRKDTPRRFWKPLSKGSGKKGEPRLDWDTGNYYNEDGSLYNAGGVTPSGGTEPVYDNTKTAPPPPPASGGGTPPAAGGGEPPTYTPPTITPTITERANTTISAPTWESAQQQAQAAYNAQYAREQANTQAAADALANARNLAVKGFRPQLDRMSSTLKATMAERGALDTSGFGQMYADVGQSYAQREAELRAGYDDQISGLWTKLGGLAAGSADWIQNQANTIYNTQASQYLTDKGIEEGARQFNTSSLFDYAGLNSNTGLSYAQLNENARQFTEGNKVDWARVANETKYNEAAIAKMQAETTDISNRFELDEASTYAEIHSIAMAGGLSEQELMGEMSKDTAKTYGKGITGLRQLINAAYARIKAREKKGDPRESYVGKGNGPMGDAYADALKNDQPVVQTIGNSSALQNAYTSKGIGNTVYRPTTPSDSTQALGSVYAAGNPQTLNTSGALANAYVNSVQNQWQGAQNSALQNAYAGNKGIDNTVYRPVTYTTQPVQSSQPLQSAYTNSMQNQWQGVQNQALTNAYGGGTTYAQILANRRQGEINRARMGGADPRTRFNSPYVRPVERGYGMRGDAMYDFFKNTPTKWEREQAIQEDYNNQMAEIQSRMAEIEALKAGYTMGEDGTYTKTPSATTSAPTTWTDPNTGVSFYQGTDGSWTPFNEPDATTAPSGEDKYATAASIAVDMKGTVQQKAAAIQATTGINVWMAARAGDDRAAAIADILIPGWTGRNLGVGSVEPTATPSTGAPQSSGTGLFPSWSQFWRNSRDNKIFGRSPLGSDNKWFGIDTNKPLF